MLSDTAIRNLATGLSTALLVTLSAGGLLFHNNSKLEDKYQRQRSYSQRLNHEKRSLLQTQGRLNGHLSRLDQEKKQLKQHVAGLQHDLAVQEAENTRLIRENTRIPELLLARKTLSDRKDALQLELEEKQMLNGHLQIANQSLSRQLNLARQDNEALTKLVNKKPVMAYNFLSEAQKRRTDKLTSKASRAHEVEISFEIQDDASLNAPYRLELRAPNGEQLSGLLAEVAQTPIREEIAFASLNKVLYSPMLAYKRVTLSFDPAEKLQKGTYQVLVYNGNQYLGTTQFSLR